MKNCGQTVHDEVANKQTMEELKELLKVVTPGGEGPCAMPIPTWSCVGHVQQAPLPAGSGKASRDGWELRLEGRDTDMGGKGSEWEAHESNVSMEGQWGDSRAGTLGEWASCPSPAEEEKAS